MRGNGKLALLADLHADEALVPTLDDLPLTDGELERLVAVIAGVELLAVGKSTLVVDLDLVACPSNAN